jgi:hypothetical protein
MFLFLTHWYIQDFVPQYYHFSALKFIKLRVGKYNYKRRKLSKCVQNRFYHYTCILTAIIDFIIPADNYNQTLLITCQHYAHGTLYYNIHV